MGLLDSLFKKNQFVEQNEDLNTIKDEETIEKEASIFEKYPNGLPGPVLDVIDYSRFGAMLKQERLLPPNYDIKPTNMKISYPFSIPRLKLRFRSTTKNSYITLEIDKYTVSCADKGSRTFYVNFLMGDVWCQFAEEVMEKWDKGYRLELLEQKRKSVIKQED